MTIRPLSLLEARALGVLVEKALTVPDSYPLSLNALTLGCNQKTGRDPVLVASEADVQVALEGLKGLALAIESSGSRVTRYAHNTSRVLGLPSQSVALLATLLLRGPQTASELRSNSERLYRFADLSATEGFLDELATRSADKGGPLVAKQARGPGAREARWVHLLSGTPSFDEEPRGHAAAQGHTDSTALHQLRMDHSALRGEVAELRALVEALQGKLDGKNEPAS